MRREAYRAYTGLFSSDADDLQDDVGVVVGIKRIRGRNRAELVNLCVITNLVGVVLGLVEDLAGLLVALRQTETIKNVRSTANMSFGRLDDAPNRQFTRVIGCCEKTGNW